METEQTSSQSTTTTTDAATNYKLPSGITLQHCAKIAIVEDRPIMFDYWTASCDKDVLSGEKLLVKNEEEYTSPISKIYKVEGEYIIMTENSIYVVSAEIPTKRVR